MDMEKEIEITGDMLKEAGFIPLPGSGIADRSMKCFCSKDNIKHESNCDFAAEYTKMLRK